ncbi:cytochrome d ubiquinol oxidase subunit II [Thermodesulfatator autotrophicus]|uniref:Cytochrome C oxidase assembly protein n=1 Tax=Thermodesulfatator autotrophicus TaxID=1795632 RepID=A0A177E817_9BACT|nr:cytochrome d ubiquinol oxidase subunit II [Thermodesulfatator autotrophicus]OAG28103.1 cytochrome C oxidase assembly protein [Thermodesulfatator autotrophicus]
MEQNIFQIIWFILWGVLWAVYFMLDGFDFGIGMLLPFAAKNDTERRIMYNSVGPVWDGNEVWLITAGGATFAAFPTTYAVMFSALYTPLLLILFALIFRGVAFEFRGKEESPLWRTVWDVCLVLGSFLPSLLFGVAFANFFKGLPIDANGIMHGNTLTLLNPYGLLGGLLFVVMFIVHGALWLAVKSNGDLQKRAKKIAERFWVLEMVLVLVFLIATGLVTDIWANYFKYKWLLVIPAAALVAYFAIPAFLSRAAYWYAWFASSAAIVFTVAFGIAGLFPRLIPSSLNPEWSLTIYNSSSSPLTLKVMTVVALVFVPLVIAYQIWTYKLFSEKIKPDFLKTEEAY